MPFTCPFFVIVPGASQTPSHYAYLSHLLHLSGYPTLSAILPSLSATAKVTVQDDTDYIRNRMLLPILDHSKRDIILIMHSYSGVPGSAAAAGLSQAERALEGKTTSVIGQIFITSLLTKDGDGTGILDALGGQYPNASSPDFQKNLLDGPNPIPALFQQVPSIILANAAAASAIYQGLTSFNHPVHRRRGIQAMIDATGVDWIVKDIESDHSPQLSRTEELVEILVGLTGVFEAL